jgi:hypothetical protein
MDGAADATTIQAAETLSAAEADLSPEWRELPRYGSRRPGRGRGNPLTLVEERVAGALSVHVRYCASAGSSHRRPTDPHVAAAMSPSSLGGWLLVEASRETWFFIRQCRITQ